MTRQDAAKISPEAVVGLLLTAVGGMLLLDKLDILRSAVYFWPVSIIGGGIALLLREFDGAARR